MSSKQELYLKAEAMYKEGYYIWQIAEKLNITEYEVIKLLRKN